MPIEQYDYVKVKTQLGDPDNAGLFHNFFTETVTIEESPIKVYSSTIGHSWIVGSSTNSIVGTNTGTEDGEQQVVGSAGRVDTTSSISNTNKRYYEPFILTTYEDTTNTSATWSANSLAFLENPEIHYKLNGDATDSSGNSRNGTATNVTWGTAGVIGTCGTFAKTSPSGITTTYGSTIDPSVTPVTVCCWAKATSASATQIFMSFGTASGTTKRMQVGMYNSYWTIGVQSTGLTSGYAGYNTTATSTDWTHIAVVMDGSNMKLYVNGAFSHQLSYTSYTFQGNFGLSIYSGQEFTGLIDDARVYSAALTATEIGQIYNSGSGTESTFSQAQSLAVAYNDGTVTTATIYLDSGADTTKLALYLSADGGSHFESVTTSTEHTFTYTGTDLRWKIVASGATTVSSIIINYG